jgi:hypothetical protein
MSADTPQRWMRDAALLAAALSVQTPPDAPVAPLEGWPGASEAWTALTLRARALALTPAAWAEAAAAAAEIEPEAAAAFSILAESERVMLPTPAVFARLAVSGLGLDYDAALAAALAPSPLLQRVETAGHALPAAHTAFRLPPEGVARLVAAAALPMGERLPATHRPVFARHAAAAARLMAEDGAVWLRGPSRRLARQLAHDLATFTPDRAALFVTARADMALPEDANDALLVLDCHPLDRLPILPRGTGRLAVLASDTDQPPGLRAVDAPPLDHGAQAAIWAEAALPCLDADRLSHLAGTPVSTSRGGDSDVHAPVPQRCGAAAARCRGARHGDPRGGCAADGSVRAQHRYQRQA